MACPYYRWNGGLFGDYWCDKNDKRVSSTEYYKYCRNYSYDECPIYRHSESSGCFLTTITCQILGKKDNDPVLNTLRNFRDNVLQKDEKYRDILINYDDIGPQIAECLANDKDKLKIATYLYNEKLTVISKLIKLNQIDLACQEYYVITTYFKNYYGLEYSNNEQNKNTDITKLGHGRSKVLKPTTI